MMVFVLKAFGWRGAPILAVAAMICITAMFSDDLAALMRIFEAIGESSGIEEASSCLLKILGIGYVSGICSDICRELGESGIASVVLTAARIESLVVISPMILEILTLGLELVGG